MSARLTASSNLSALDWRLAFMSECSGLPVGRSGGRPGPVGNLASCCSLVLALRQLPISDLETQTPAPAPGGLQLDSRPQVSPRLSLSASGPSRRDGLSYCHSDDIPDGLVATAVLFRDHDYVESLIHTSSQSSGSILKLKLSRALQYQCLLPGSISRRASPSAVTTCRRPGKAGFVAASGRAVAV